VCSSDLVARHRLSLIPELLPWQTAAFEELVARRAARVPLQYLIGTAPMADIQLAVGPGVFVPRLETELVYAWAVAELRDRREPLVVDLCAGTGALALAIAHARPDARVHAVELDPRALVWTRRNAGARVAAGDTPVTVHAGDVTDPALLRPLSGRVDLVVTNPPYIPLGAELEPEVARHDPHIALFGGSDGLEVIRAMAPTIARLLRPAGAVAIEHDDSHGGAVAALLRDHDFLDIVEHNDFAGKPRYVVARRP